ncbi:MAG: hypothetical protein HYY24_17525 [Verrucomicrobia bacterium]|nr:hypothetical protein [Verrucomicrobiota bacterium]
MSSTTARCLMLYGLIVMIVGMLAHRLDPELAKTLPWFSGPCGALCILWGVLGSRGLRAGRVGFVLTTIPLMYLLIVEMVLGWSAVLEKKTEKIIVPTLVTLLLLTSGGMLVFLLYPRPGSDATAAAPRKS